MDFMTPIAVIAGASLDMICEGTSVPYGTEAELAYGLIATCTGVLVEELGPDAPKLLAMCGTATHAKYCLLKARAKAAELRELEGKSCDLDDVHRLRSEYNALHFNAGAFCREDRHQVVFDETVNLVPGPFERAVVEAASKPENVFRVPESQVQQVPGSSAPARSFVAALLGTVDNAGAVVGLIPGNVAPNTPATFADFDPLGAGAALYSNGPEATAELYADASAVADSTAFKMLSLRALCAAGAAGHSSSYSTQDKTLSVWRAILAFVERDPQERAKLVDVTVLLQDPAHKTVAAAVLPTLLRPSVRLLTAITAISPSVQTGDLTAFAANYAAAAQKMAQGLAPGQRAYFTIAQATEAVEATKSEEAAKSAEEATRKPEPSGPQRKRARTDSTTTGLSAGHSGRSRGHSGREARVVWPQ